MAPTNAIAGPEVHDRGIMQLAPELTIDGPQQDGYSKENSAAGSDLSKFFKESRVLTGDPFYVQIL
ncbi:hypothetical protein [Brevibacterium aurantiacum]|uniref:hypothetical protein n=1 Tax=Brevibacterium aurantiacum TaxID=273384 RepID=UPI0001BC2C87|nr:hypothetical protein [Brevibacterium aurantiacum]